MNRKALAIAGKIGAILLWAAAFYLAFYLSYWQLLAALLFIHLVEIPLAGYKAGIKAGHSPAYSIVMTLIFGFTWWKYLD